MDLRGQNVVLALKLLLHVSSNPSSSMYVCRNHEPLRHHQSIALANSLNGIVDR